MTRRSAQSWNRVTGHRVTGHRVSDYGRVGSGLGSLLYMNRPGVMTRFPAEQKTDSFVQQLALYIR